MDVSRSFEVGRAGARRILGAMPLRSFATLESEGVIVPSLRGLRGRASVYRLEEIVPAYIAYLTKIRPVMADREARARRDSTLAELNTLKLQQQRGELIPRSQAVTDGQTYTKAWAAMVRALPRRLRQAGLVTGELEAAVAAMCRELLVEISRWGGAEELAPLLEDGA